jgi:hypothetical protein
MLAHGAHPFRRMSRHLFQLNRLSSCSPAFFDQFSRSERAAYRAVFVAECTDSLQSFVHSLPGDVFLELGAESNSFTLYAEYHGDEVITVSWICL